MSEQFEGIFYRVGMWRGMPNYKCMECNFATLDGADKVIAHVRRRHFNWAEKRQPMIVVANKRGQEVASQEREDAGMAAMAGEAIARSEVIGKFGEDVGAMLIDAGLSSLSSIKPLTTDDLVKIEGIGKARARKILREMGE
ncbi:hypothetical protein ES705_07271 [subsurface metagenome]